MKNFIKTSFLGLCLAFLMVQPVAAASSHETASSDSNPTTTSLPTVTMSNLGEMDLTQLDESAPPTTTLENQEFTSPHIKTTDVSGTEEVTTPMTKKEAKMAKRVQRVADKTEGGMGFGVVSFVLGLTAFLLGWIFWPVGLLLAGLAIGLGIVGLGRHRSGRGLAAAGLIFGILTIVIPILIVALLIAAMA